VGYPNLSLLGNIASTLDFAGIRFRRNIEVEIPGNHLRNQLNFYNQDVDSVKDKLHRQTNFAEWTKDAFRWAYPYGRMDGYPDSMPLDVEAAIMRGRDTNPITTGELEAWCALINAADDIPHIYA
jgi:hypothetical protein